MNEIYYEKLLFELLQLYSDKEVVIIITDEPILTFRTSLSNNKKYIIPDENETYQIKLADREDQEEDFVLESGIRSLKEAVRLYNKL